MNCAILLMFLILLSSVCTGQALPPDQKKIDPAGRPPHRQSSDSGYYFNGICKQLPPETRINDGPGKPSWADLPSSPFITIRGNIQYDFIYRSLVDTPFLQKDFSQHSVQTNMEVVLAQHYPFRVNVLSRRSNSPYFSNITDVNVQFNKSMFFNQLKEKLRREAGHLVSNGQRQINELEQAYRQKQQQYAELQSWLNNPLRLQELVEEKERTVKEAAMALAKEKQAQLKDSLSTKASALKDSVKARFADSSSNSNNKLARFEEKFEQKKKMLDSLVKQLKGYEDKMKKVKGALQDSLTKLKEEIAKINDPAALKEYARKTKTSLKEMPKGWQLLGSINQIGLGRTWVDYSELTVKNISLTGVNLEMNPSNVYFAVAAGRINARFRDFVIKDNQTPHQSLYLIRAGIGKKDKNNFIVTFYNGKRSLIDPMDYLGGTAGSLEKVAGISLESRITIDENNYVVLETARSSFFTTGNQNRGDQDLMGKIWNLKDGSNQAYSVKAGSFWPQTNTQITGYYRKMGEHFQSFNLLPVNVDQEAYLLKVQQKLWKKRLLLEAGIRKNDFNNPYTSQGLNSKTVFKSFLASLRVPKYPVVSVGFYPSSQLTVLDNKVIAENQYNTLTATVSHSYRFNQVSMSTNAMYLRFYNQGTDTGFIYFNATSWSLNHYIFWKKLQTQSGLSYTGQQELKVLTLEQGLTYQLRQWLSVGGGLKYNRLLPVDAHVPVHPNQERTQWGGMGIITIDIRKTGTIQLQYDRSFLPGMQRNLLPVDMGKLSFYRSF